MTFEVFLSYSERDLKYVEAIVQHLEGKGVRCWYAPRDIVPGEKWPAAITRALSQVKIMILVFSSNSINSKHVAREMELADRSPNVTVVPVRIENVLSEEGSDLPYYLANTHWLDAVGKDIDVILQYLEVSVFRILGRSPGQNLEERPSFHPDSNDKFGDDRGVGISVASAQAQEDEKNQQPVEMADGASLGMFAPAERSRMEPVGLADLISKFPAERQDFLRTLANTELCHSSTILLTQVRSLVGEDDYGKDVQRWLYSSYPLKRGMYFNPLVIENVLSSFTNRQATFLRALIAAGHGGKDVITTADVDSVVKANKGLNWPQWLRTSPEFVQSRRGMYHNPIQLRLKSYIQEGPNNRAENLHDEQNGDLLPAERSQAVAEAPIPAGRSKFDGFDGFRKELDPNDEKADFVSLIRLIHDDVRRTFPDAEPSYSKTRITFFNNAFPRRAKSFLTLGVWSPPVRIRIEKERTEEELPEGAVEDWYKKSQWMAFNFNISRPEEYSKKVREYIRRNYQRGLEGKSLEQ